MFLESAKIVLITVVIWYPRSAFRIFRNQRNKILREVRNENEHYNYFVLEMAALNGTIEFDLQERNFSSF